MIKINNKQSFTDDFMKEFSRYAFGSMSKKELELLIFKLILQDRGELTQYNKFELSKLLKITESRVKTLYNEVQLREDELFNDEWFILELRKMLSILKIENSTKKIVLQIDNPLFKSMFENIMRQDGVIVDYSFNKDIIKIDENAFSLILNYILDDEEKTSIIDKINKVKDTDIDFTTLSKLAASSFVKSASSKAGEKFTEYGLDFASGGITSFINIVKKVLRANDIF